MVYPQPYKNFFGLAFLFVDSLLFLVVALFWWLLFTFLICGLAKVLMLSLNSL